MGTPSLELSICVEHFQTISDIQDTPDRQPVLPAEDLNMRQRRLIGQDREPQIIHRASAPSDDAAAGFQFLRRGDILPEGRLFDKTLNFFWVSTANLH